MLSLKIILILLMNKDNKTINKKKFIYNNINSITNTQNIIEFIVNNDISYSQNANGMHVNISILDDKLINEIYNIIFYEINDKNEDKKYITEYNTALQNIKSQKKKITEKNIYYKKIKLNDIQKEMINLIQ